MRAYVLTKYPRETYGNAKPAVPSAWYRALLELPRVVQVNGPDSRDDEVDKELLLQEHAAPASPDGALYSGPSPTFRSTVVMKLHKGSRSTVWLREGIAGEMAGKKFVSKTWSQPFSHPATSELLTEIALYDSPRHLRKLQGFVVPRVVGVYTDGASTSLALEPPDGALWIAAGAGMPAHARDRCVWALRQVHARGVLHGNIALHHFLITQDWRVQIVDFSRARVRACDAGGLLRPAAQEEFDAEVRALKDLLDAPPSGQPTVEGEGDGAEAGGGDVVTPGLPTSLDEGPFEGPTASPSLGLLERTASPTASDTAPPPAAPPMRVIVPGQTPQSARQALESMLRVFDVPKLTPVTAWRRDAADLKWGYGGFQKLRLYEYAPERVEKQTSGVREAYVRLHEAEHAARTRGDTAAAEKQERRMRALAVVRCKKLYPAVLYPELQAHHGPPILSYAQSQAYHRTRATRVPPPSETRDRPLKPCLRDPDWRPSESELERMRQVLARQDKDCETAAPGDILCLYGDTPLSIMKMRYNDMQNREVKAPYPYGWDHPAFLPYDR